MLITELMKASGLRMTKAALLLVVVFLGLLQEGHCDGVPAETCSGLMDSRLFTCECNPLSPGVALLDYCRFISLMSSVLGIPLNCRSCYSSIMLR